MSGDEVKQGLREGLEYMVDTTLEEEKVKHYNAGVYYRKRHHSWMVASICIPSLITCCSALAEVGHISPEMYKAVVTCLGAITTFITSFLAIKKYQKKMEAHQNTAKCLAQQQADLRSDLADLELGSGDMALLKKAKQDLSAALKLSTYPVDQKTQNARPCKLCTYAVSLFGCKQAADDSAEKP